MTSLATTVKRFANLFYSCPAQNPAHRPTKHPPRLYLPHRIAFRRNRCSAEEVRIIDNQKTTSRRKWKKVLMAHQRDLRAPELRCSAPWPSLIARPDHDEHNRKGNLTADGARVSAAPAALSKTRFTPPGTQRACSPPPAPASREDATRSLRQAPAGTMAQRAQAHWPASGAE